MATNIASPAGRIMLRNVRLAFPNLFEPSSYGEGDPAYSATLIMDQQQAEAVDKALAAVARDKWGAKADAQLKALRASGKVCLRDGDEKADYDGFEGMMFVAARSKTRPTVVDGQRQPLTQGDGRIYAGCYVNASLEIWAQDNGYGKRINATLRGIQFVRDGEAFGGGRPAAADEFDEIEADELV
jgi:hypothetical protein